MMGINKAITWTVSTDDGNGDIVLQQREGPKDLVIKQGIDQIYFHVDNAREVYRALGELIELAEGKEE